MEKKDSSQSPMKYRKVGEYQMERAERKINSIYDNLRNDGPLID